MDKYKDETKDDPEPFNEAVQDDPMAWKLARGELRDYNPCRFDEEGLSPEEKREIDEGLTRGDTNEEPYFEAVAEREEYKRNCL